MTAKELFTYLTHDAGLDDATAQAVMKAAENEKVAAKAGSLKQATEYDTLLTKSQSLEQSLAKAKSYEDWYAKNFPAIQALQTQVTKYTERYGSLDEPTKDTKTFSNDDVKKIVTEAITERYDREYAPKTVGLVTSVGTILERHIRAGRKKEIDWKKIDELAATAGDPIKAYEEWDKPEAEAAAEAAKLKAKEDQEKEIERRVKEEVQKRQTREFFPAGGDGTPSSTVSPLSRSKVASEPKYDRSKVVEAAVTGKYEGAVQ